MVKATIATKKKVALPQVVTVRQFAEALNLPVGPVIAKLLGLGVKATINESIDLTTAQITGDELGFEVVAQQAQAAEKQVASKLLKERPPIVTVMGHVDHGKTQLLDRLRETDVVSKESGGITQGIGAYQVTTGKRQITFLDTPGHEAFSALRAHGANITDIVVLIVAADEGIKPQTVEAISHARASEVPIIVAINKVDLPNADPEKVKRQLAEHNLLPEDYGGKIPTVEVSAKTGHGIKELLEIILITTDLLELKADPTTPALGVVIESHVEPGVGPVATCLPMQGTLKTGQIIVIGSTWGKIRAMADWHGRRLKEAGPGTPVQVSGLKALPHFADLFKVSPSEREAKELAATLLHERVVHRLAKKVQDSTGEEAVSLTELNLIVKVDVVGSLEAIKQSINQMTIPGISFNFVHLAVGQVSESDVNLAETTGSIILAFRTDATAQVAKLAQVKKVELRSYQVIYQLLDDLKGIATGKLEPQVVEKPAGTFTVIKSFFQIRSEAVVGGRLDKGRLEPGVEARVMRGETLLGKVKINSIKLGAADVDEATTGKEYGLRVSKLPGQPFRIKPADRLDCYKTEKVLR